MEAKRAAALAKQKRDEEERARLKVEQEQRDLERRKKEEAERKQREFEEAGAEAPGVVVESTGDAELDREAVLMKQRESELKAQKEAEKRIVNLGKRMDYLERALREANRPKVVEAWKAHCVELVRMRI